MDRLRQLLKEIHRRSIWQVLGVYVLGAWIGYEVVLSLVEGLGLPDWFPGFAILLLIVGLPIVLATAIIQREPPSFGARDETLLAAVEPAAVRPGGVAHRVFTWRNAIAGGVIAFALWGVVAAAFVLRPSEPSVAASNPAEASVAVLPFNNVGNDPENAAVTEGIHDDLLTQLSKIAALRVTSRTSVVQYANTTKNIRDIAAELGVRTILEGGVQRAGNRVRINAQLIDAGTDEHLWADHFDRELTVENIFRIQTEIATAIARALEAELTVGEEERIRSVPTRSLEAYELYSQARSEFYKYTLPGNAAAVDLYESALEIDPTYALALAGLSLCYSQYLNRGWSGDAHWLERAEDAARRALDVDPELAEAHFALGFAYEQRGKYDEEEVWMRRALALNPNHAHAHDSMGDILKVRGRFDEAIAQYRIALRLDPQLEPARRNLGLVEHLRGRYRAAREQYLENQEKHPNVDASYLLLGDLLLEVGEATAARKSYERALRAQPGSVLARVGIAEVELALGNVDGARDIAERLLEEAGEQSGPAHAYLLGRIVLAEGSAGTAVAHSEHGLELEDEVARRRRLQRADMRYEIGLAEALIAAGSPGRAVGIIRNAMEDASYVKRLRLHLARALEAAGEREPAVEQYRGFLEDWRGADPGAPPVSEARARLRALGRPAA